MKKELPKRKNIRIQKYDYSKPGTYFITICTEKRKKVLSKIIYNNTKNKAKIKLYPAGIISKKHIEQINNTYQNIKIEKYTIMPNHIHMIIKIKDENNKIQLSRVIAAFKRFTNKEYVKTIWQRNYYEHIIRNEKEYLEILEYIQNNPLKWYMDKYYE